MASETLSTTVIAEQTKPEEQAKTPIWTHREPLQLKGVLDQYESFDVTPVIGREFKDVNLKEWLNASNSDDLLRDLAITSTLSISDYNVNGAKEYYQSLNAASSSSASKTT